MARTPKVSLIAYADRDPRFIFVALPDHPGRYVRTLRCVGEVDCPACKSAIGEPCKSMSSTLNGRLRYWAGTHCERRRAWDMRHRPIAERPPFRDWLHGFQPIEVRE